MKKSFIIIQLIIFLSGCVSSPVYYNKTEINKKSTIAILPFINYNNGNNSGQLITDIFSVSLLEKGFNVISREDINQFLKGEKIDIKKIDRASIKKIGALLNADYLIIGSVTDYNSYSNKRRIIYVFEWLRITYSVSVTARIIDTSEGNTIWIGSASDLGPSFPEAGDVTIKTLLKTIKIK